VTEAIAYPKSKVFGVQGHPEWQNIDGPSSQWVLQQIREICFGEGKVLQAGAR